jgi:hypothetical protein
MAENDNNIAQTEEEAIRRGYERTDASALRADPKFFARRRPCGGAVEKGDWCLITNCRPDNTQTVCYCDGNGNCANCYIAPCENQ